MSGNSYPSARLTTFARRVETMEVEKTKDVKSVFNYNEVPCAICENNTHIIHHCPTILGLKEALNQPLYSGNSQYLQQHFHPYYHEPQSSVCSYEPTPNFKLEETINPFIDHQISMCEFT